MAKKNKLEFEIETMFNITMQANENYLIVRKLNMSDNEAIIDNIKVWNTFFHFVGIMSWQQTVINLCILLNKEEKFSIIKLLNKLKKGGYYSKILTIDPHKIEDWERTIESESMNIENLFDQRNKLYAHRDYTHNNIVNIVNLDTTDKLLNVAKDIVQEVVSITKETHQSFELLNSPVRNLDDILKGMAEMLKEKEAYFNSLEKEHGLIEPSDLTS